MRNWFPAAAAAAVLVSAPVLAASGGVSAILSSPSRPEADKARDGDRKPAEVTAFAGVRPGMKIAEIAPGGGYFTRVLSLSVGPKGYVYAFGGRPSAAVIDLAKASGNVAMIVGKVGETALAPEKVDLVWTTQNYHDFKNAKVGDGDAAAVYNKEAWKALKPGGIYLVSDHEAAKGSGTSATSTLHRIESAAVIKEVEAAGFKLVGSSKLLAHPADDHTLRVIESGIRGKTDQFLLKFRKVGK